MKRRFVAILLTLMMLMQALPMEALAEWATTISNEIESATYRDVKFFEDDEKKNAGDHLAHQLVEDGHTLPAVPEDRSKDNATFEGWVDPSFNGGQKVTTSTPITQDVNAVATFNEISVYTVTIQYMYGDEKVFDSVVAEYAANDTETYTVPSPVSVTAQDGETVYTSQTEVEIVPSELSALDAADGVTDAKVTITVEYKLADATYEIRYYGEKLPEADDQPVAPDAQPAEPVYDMETPLFVLKNQHGVAGADVDPVMLTAEQFLDIEHYEYSGKYDQLILMADNEQGAKVHNVLNIYYNRKTYTLRYDSQGGSYVDPKTGKYGQSVDVYEVSGGERVLRYEHEEHTHTDACGKQLIWDHEEHTHTDECYQAFWGKSELPVCGKWGHTHTDSCYRYTCGKSEHTHTDSCYTTTPTVTSPTPTRQGYTFDGWYKNEECTEPASASEVLNGDVTVYAKWTPGKANYTIAYFRELNEGGYAFISAKTESGTVGEQVTGSGDASFTNSNYYTKNNSKTTSARIAADGSTVVAVYYDLKVYTLTFKHDQTIASNRVNHSGTILTMDRAYHGNGDYYSFTARYGDDISAKWPAADKISNDKSGNSSYFYGWNYSGAERVAASKRLELSADLIPNANNTEITYYGTWASVYNYNLHYYLQDPDDPNKYVESPDYHEVARGNDTFGQKDIVGFKKLSGKPSGGDKTFVADNDPSKTGGTACTFYYDRLTYSITYYYKATKLDTKDNIAFGKNINLDTYKSAPASRPADVDPEATFVGWYDNADCLGDPYNFDKMPAGNFVLYAKYKMPDEKVTFKVDYEGGEADKTETVEKGKAVDADKVPTPNERPGWSFDGWFLEDGTRFNPDAPITHDTTVKAHWSRKGLNYTVRYVEKGSPDYALLPDVPKTVAPEVVTDHYTVTVSAVHIDGYRVSGEVTKTVELVPDSENVITFEYVKAADTTYRIEYIDKNTGTVIEQIGDLPVSAEQLRVVARPKAIKGYYHDPSDAYIKTLDINADATQNVIKFYYLPLNTVKVERKHIFKAGDQQAEVYDPTIESLIVGDSASIEQRTGEGIEFEKYGEDGDYYVATADDANQTVTLEAIYNIAQWHLEFKYVGENANVAPLPEGHDFYYHVGDLNIGTEEYTITENPTLSDYNFDGWYRDPECTQKVEKVHQPEYHLDSERRTVTVYGKWVPKTGKLTITKEIKDETDNKITGPQTFTFSVNGAEEKTVTVTVEAGATTGSASVDLKPGRYTVTEQDADDYIVTGEGNVTIEAGKTTEITINNEKKNPKLSVTKTANKTEGAVIGDTITYTITVKNEGNVDLTDVAVSDDKLDQRWTIDSLPVGQSDVHTVKYNVKASDIKAGSIVNTATAKATYEGHNVTASDDATVGTEKKDITITITGEKADHTYDGTEYTVDQYTVSGLPTDTENDIKVEMTGNITVKRTDAGMDVQKLEGNFTVTSDAYEVTVNYVDGELKINKRAATVTSASAEKEYDGTPLTDSTVTGTGFVEGEGVHGTATGSQLVAGSSKNPFTYEANEGTNLNNYDITKVEGTLTVTDRTEKYEITVKAKSDTVTYDGTEHSVSGFVTETFTVNGQQYTVSGLSASASGTNAGEYTSTVTGEAAVKDTAGNDVTKQFTVKTENGTLTIGKRKVTLTSGDGSKEYDGTPLTNEEITVGGDGFVEGEGATYNVTGSQLVAGSSANAFTYELNENTNKDNYEITTEFGTLTVKDRTNKYEITVKAKSETVTYDGQNHEVEGFETLTFEVEGHTYTVEGLTASASGKDANEYPSTVTGEAVVKDAAGNDVTAQFTVNKVDGKLTINKRKVTLTSADDSKEYDGTALENHNVTADGFVGNDGATYNVTGSQTLVGESANEFTYTLNNGTNPDNYEISKVEGTLTVKDRTEKYEITVKANSDTVTYDGQNHSVSGFESLEFEFNGQKYTVEGLSASANGKDAGEYPSTVTGEAVVKDAAGNDVTDQFTVNKVPGTLTIRSTGLTVTKTASKTTGAELKDEITYTITVENSGDVTVNNITVKDDKTGDSWTIESLAPDAMRTFTTEYTVSEGDILLGSITNTATATGKPEDLNTEDAFKPPAVEGSATVTVTTATQNPGLTVYKTVEKIGGKPNNDETHASLNDEVVYKIRVKNTGNVTVKDITITDELTGNVGEKVITLPQSLAPGKETSVTVSHTVTEADILGATRNGTNRDMMMNYATAKGTAANGEPVEASNHVGVLLDEVKPVLTVTKTASGPNPAKLGDTITYTITVTNDGNVTVSNIDVDDDKTGATWTIDSLKPGATSEEFTTTYAVTEDDILAGKIDNTATAKGTDPANKEVTDSDTETVTDETDPTDPDKPVIEKPNAVLTATKTASDKAGGYKAGDTVSFLITVKNEGNLTVSGIKLNDVIAAGDPANLSLNALQYNAADGFDLAPGESKEVTAFYQVTPEDIARGTITNTVIARGTPNGSAEPIDSNTATAMVDTETAVPALTVDKAHTSTATNYKVGDEIHFTIDVTNSGNVKLENVTVTDEKANRLTIPGDGDNDGDIDELQPGETVRVDAYHTVTQEDIDVGEVVNTAIAAATGATGSDTDTVTIDQNPGLTSTKMLTNSGSGDNGAFKATETATFDIVVENTGNTTQKNVVVTDTMPGAKIVAGDGYTLNGDGTATITEIAPNGGSVTVKAEYTVTQDDIDNQTELENTATVGGEGEKTGPDPEPIPTEDRNPGLKTTKTLTNSGSGENGAFKATETATFDIVVENTGNTTQKNVVVTDTMPGAKIVAGDGYTLNGDGTATITEIAPNGGSVTVKAEYTVTQDDIDNQTELENTATVGGEGEKTGPDPEPIPTEDRNPGLKTTKTLTNSGSGENGAFKATETATFDIVVENTGNTTQHDVVVTETMPGAKIVGGTGYTVNGDGTATITEIAPKASVTVKAEYTVTQDDIDNQTELANTATVGGDGEKTGPDPEPIPTEDRNAALTVTKTADVAEAKLGDTINYTITVTNSGNVTVDNITVDDQFTGYRGKEPVTLDTNSLKPGDSATATLTHKVTEDDIERGYVQNNATASGTYASNTPVTSEQATATTVLLDDITVTKVWDDQGYLNVDHPSINVTLSGDDGSSRTVTLTDNGSDTWTHTFENVPLATTDGKPIQYTVGENHENLPWWESWHFDTTIDQSSLTITNTYNPQGEGWGRLIVTKQWLGSDGRPLPANEHPTSATVTVYPNGDPNNPVWSGELNEANGYRVELTVSLLQFAVGGYRARENHIDGFELRGNGTYEAPRPSWDASDWVTGTLALTNVYTPGTKPVTVTKVWKDENGNVITGDGTPSATVVVTGNGADSDFVLTEANNYTDTKDLPKFNTKGVEITYAVKSEPTLPTGYVMSTEVTSPDNFTVTNTLKGDTVEVTATKVWEDELRGIQDRDHFRPTSVTLQLRQDGEPYDGATLSAVNGTWYAADLSTTWTVPKYNHAGNVATYNVIEPDVPQHYTASYAQDGDYNFTVTNTHEVAYVTIEKRVVPNDDGKVGLFQLGEEIKYQIVVTNNGQVALKNVKVTDKLTGLNETIASLAVGASQTFDTSHIVTEDDIIDSNDGGNLLYNTAKVHVDADDASGLALDHSAIRGVSLVQPNPELTVVKTADKVTGAELDEEITYTITVTNSGNLTVNDIIVEDEQTDFEQSVGTLAPGASTSVTTKHTITEEDILAGSFVNTATATGTAKNGADVTATDDETVKTVEPNGHVAITKTVTSTPANGSTYALGETISYEITATNDGNLTVTDVVVTDELTGDSWTIESLAPGETSETFTASHVVTEDDILAGSVVNVATATGTSPDPDEPDVPVDPGEKEVPTDPKDASLSVRKTIRGTSNGGYELGDPVTFHIVVTNDGNLTVTDIAVTDPLTELNETIDSLAPGESEDFTTTYKVTEADILAGRINNIAFAAGSDPDGGNVTAQDDATAIPVNPNGHMTISKTTTSKPANGETYALGETISYKVTATNDGNLTLTEIEVTDELTGGSWTIDSLAPGASETFETSYVVTEANILAGNVVNVATATGTSPDPDEPDVPVDPGEKEDPTDPQKPELKVTKRIRRSNGGYDLNDEATYGVTVENVGNVTLTDITVTDELTGDEWTIESLAPGARESFTTQAYTVTEDDILAGNFTNKATATGTAPSGEEVTGESSVTAYTVAQRPHVTIAKEATSTPTDGSAYALNETIIYKITATNDGNVTVTDITVTDDLTGDVWTIDSLAPGASEEFTTTYTVTEADILAGHVLNVATGTSTDPDNPPIVPGDEDKPTQKPAPSLFVEKTADKTSGLKLGEEITYTITVTNNGNVTVSNVTVYDAKTGLSETVGTLAPGAQSDPITTTYTVTEADILAGEIVNIAQARGTDPDGNSVGYDGTATVTTEAAAPALTVTKTVLGSNAGYDLGDTVTYHITVENTGNLTLTNVDLNDALTGSQFGALATGGLRPVNLPTTLAPGEQFDTYTQYTVTEANIKDGGFENTATATGTASNGSSVEDSGSVSVTTAKERPALTSTKTLTNEGSGEDGAFKANETAIFDIVVENTGNVTQTNVTVTDTLAGAKLVAGDGYTVNADGTATITEIAPNASVTVKAEYTVTQTDIDNGTAIANTATVDGDGTTPDPDPEPIPIEDQNPGLTTTKTLTNEGTGTDADGTPNGSFKANETATFDIVVENTGNTTQKNVVVTEAMWGATIVAGDGYAVNADGTATITEIAPNASVTVKAEYTVTQTDIDNGAELANTATVDGDGTMTGPDPEPIPTEEQKPGLTTTKRLTNEGNGTDANGNPNGSFKAGDIAEFDITVTNTGNTTQTDVTVTEQLNGAWFVLNSENYYRITNNVVTIPEMAPGAVVVVKAQYKIKQSDIDSNGTLTNIALVEGEGTIPDPTPDADIPEEPQKPGLTVEKTASAENDPVGLDDTITYTIKVTNSGNVTVSDIEVTDPLTGNEGENAWTIESLAPGASEEFTTTYTVTEDDILAGQVVNTATATGADPNGAEVTGSDTETVTNETDPENPDKPVIEDVNGELTVTKTASATSSPVGLNDTITYTITVENSGNVTVSDITVTDPLTGLRQSVGTLEPGASAAAITTTYTVTEADILAGSVVNTATATGADPNGDPVTGNDTETVGNETNPIPDPDNPDKPVIEDVNGVLTVEKTASATSNPVRVGEQITYTITVTNDGNVTVSNITVTDPLTGLRQSVGTLEPGASAAAITTTYTVTEVDILAGSVLNTATAAGTDPNGDDVTGTGSATVDNVPDPNNPDEPVLEPVVPGMTVNKTAPVGPYGVGDTITYTITVTNTGNVALTNVNVTDDMTGLDRNIASIPVGSTATLTTTHVVTQAEINAGTTLTNVADVTADNPNDPNSPLTGQGTQTVTVLPRVTLTVNYWYGAIGGAVAAPTFTRTYFAGDAYYRASPFIAGYNRSRASVSGTMPRRDLVLNVIYTAIPYTLTINYVYEDGTVAAAAYTDTLTIGDGYTVASPTIEGYTASDLVVAGTMPGRNLTFTVIYVPVNTDLLIDEYGVPLNIGNVTMNVGDCFE